MQSKRRKHFGGRILSAALYTSVILSVASFMPKIKSSDLPIPRLSLNMLACITERNITFSMSSSWAPLASINVSAIAYCQPISRAAPLGSVTSLPRRFAFWYNCK